MSTQPVNQRELAKDMAKFVLKSSSFTVTTTTPSGIGVKFKNGRILEGGKR